MILLKKGGDLFQSTAQTLVVPVNTVGTLGCGLAKAFDLRFDGLLAAYKKACWNGTFATRGLFVFNVSEERKVLCFPTKRHWSQPSKLSWLDHSLGKLATDYESYGITSLAIPALGCGYGQLKWETVLPLIKEHLDSLTIDIEVYAPW